jgi:hypothetical protein
MHFDTTVERFRSYWQMMTPSTPVVAPAPTCTEHVFMLVVLMVGLLYVTVYPLVAGVTSPVLPVDSVKLLAVTNWAKLP